MELKTRAKRNQREYVRLRVYGWLWAVAVSALAVAFIFTALFFAIRVTDDGMAPCVQQNDILLFGRLSHLTAAPERGDLLAFRSKKRGPVTIGRAVALPNETVTIVSGAVYINGMLLEESAYATGVCADMAPLLVPEGTFFVLPDARAFADVSDTALLLVDGRAITGTARLRVYPFMRIALFE